jgi:hypothetical protein
MGPVTYGQEEEPIFLGKEIARHKDYSEETAQRIDRAITRILEDGQKKAAEILSGHKKELEILSDALLIRETLVDDEVRSLLGFPPRENISSLTGPAPAESASSEAAPAESASSETVPSEAVSPEAASPELVPPEGEPPAGTSAGQVNKSEDSPPEE